MPHRTHVQPSAERSAPRFTLDVDWFVESEGSSAMGRGLVLSPRGAMLPVFCHSPFTPQVTLYIALPARERMFKASCSAMMFEGRGWSLRFKQVSPEDLQLLGQSLVSDFGAAALPNLEGRLATPVHAY